MAVNYGSSYVLEKMTNAEEVLYDVSAEEVAFFAKGYYVLVQESSLCGLDYSIYNSSFDELDGGVITDLDEEEYEDKVAFGIDMLLDFDNTILYTDAVLVNYSMVQDIADGKPYCPVPEKKPIVAVDFDGTLVRNQYPDISNPDLSLISFIREHKDDYIWILNTCRKGQCLVDAVYYMAKEHEIFFDYVNENTLANIEHYGNTRKIYADIYIDNSAMSAAAFLLNNKEVQTA